MSPLPLWPQAGVVDLEVRMRLAGLGFWGGVTHAGPTVLTHQILEKFVVLALLMARAAVSRRGTLYTYYPCLLCWLTCSWQLACHLCVQHLVFSNWILSQIWQSWIWLAVVFCPTCSNVLASGVVTAGCGAWCACAPASLMQLCHVAGFNELPRCFATHAHCVSSGTARRVACWPPLASLSRL